MRDHWLLWQLADSAFPAGSFGHSSGLEAAWQLGEISSLESYVQSSLQQLRHAALPFVLEAHRQQIPFSQLDERCDLFLSNHVANRGSRLTGKSFLTAAAQSFPSPALAALRSECSIGHLAPLFGATTRLLEIDAPATTRLFIYIHLRGQLASAVRLNIIGPLEAQRLQFKLSPAAESIAQKSLHLTIDDIAHTVPLLDVWQGAHDRLYSRLFQT